jgi:dolichyl-phosphate-mannose-protein mannosyltransferase
MASGGTPQGSLRQRNTGSKKALSASSSEVELDKLAKAASQATTASSEREYKVGLALITILSFLTRFWGISHPNEVVFDEVHFGKVREMGFFVSMTVAIPRINNQSVL